MTFTKKSANLTPIADAVFTVVAKAKEDKRINGEENVIDAGEIFIANKILGDEKGKSFIAGFDREKMDEAVILKNVKYNVYGENVGIEFLQKNYN